jgi:hypothetical protein
MVAKHREDFSKVDCSHQTHRTKLFNWDNILIAKKKDLVINFEIPQAGYLTKFILNPVKGRKVVVTKSQQLQKSALS